MKAAWIAVLLTLVPLQQAHPWDQEGHSIVAEIAQRRLDSDTLKKVKALFGGEISLASIASWADDYRATHKKTSGWHFVDIPYERNTYEAAVDCKDDSEKGDCIINANDRVQKTLADCTKPNGERVEALKFLVHFVGDVHQPLHTAERNGDGGGNGVHVSFFGKNVNLHEVWDTEIIRHTVFAWGTYVSRLEEQWFAGRDLSGLDAGTPIDWALQSHKLAHDVAYDFPAGDPQLGKEYYTKRPTALCL